MSKQYNSPLMASIHETADSLHTAGIMSKRTMREFDHLCLTPVRPLTRKQIRADESADRHVGKRLQDLQRDGRRMEHNAVGCPGGV